MKKIALCILLVSTFLWAAPSPDDYPIDVHVVSSYFVTVPGHGGSVGESQKLSVLIGGKKYELTAIASRAGLLSLGDYKAKLIRDEHKTTYQSNQEYELLFPDKTTKKFYVTGQSE
jgi:hypothetical protein